MSINLNKKLMRYYPSFPYNEVDGILFDILKPDDFVLVETGKSFMIKQIKSIKNGKVVFIEVPNHSQIDKKSLPLRECVPAKLIFNDHTIKSLYDIQNGSEEDYIRVIHILKWLKK